MLRILIVSVILGYFSSSVIADIYKWIDDEGGVHFTDSIELIPEKYLDKSRIFIKEKQQKKTTKTDEGETPEKPASAQNAAPVTKKSGSIKVDKEGHDEAWWHRLVKEKEDSLKQLIMEKTKLEADLQPLSRRFNNPAFGGRGRKSLASEVEELQNRIKSLDEAIARVKENLEKTLPEEAAKAGAPLEWLR